MAVAALLIKPSSLYYVIDVKICIGMGSGSKRNSQVLDIACLAMVEMVKI